MSNMKAKHIDEIPYYQGPNAIPGIKFRMAARDVGGNANDARLWRKTRAKSIGAMTRRGKHAPKHAAEEAGSLFVASHSSG